MYHSGPTSDALLLAATRLFARHGFDGTSVRTITREAGANLGAVTYHFGSKEALYDAVVSAANAAVDERLDAAAEEPGTPLERVCRVVRTFFDIFAEYPEYPQLIMHELLSMRPMPEDLRAALERRIGKLVALIRAGQQEGGMRQGEPLLLALSVGSQPLWLAMAARPLREGVRIDQADPETRERLAESVVEFVRAGLAAHSEG